MIKKIDRKAERERRHARVRNKISGTADRPRLCVFRSNNNLFVQVIDDVADKNDKVKYLTRSQFAQYASEYVNSKSGKIGLDALKKLDCEQAQAIQDTLSNYVASYKTDIEK